MGRTSTPKPHPLTPSPRRGEGEHKEKSSRSSPLSALRRGGQGVRSTFTRKLLAWWARAARDLPWRRTRDPYRVLVSEFMLQQTQVSRVAEYYPRFLERFPDLQTLASARPRAVREAWDGLGYYARASNLHALARVVSRDLDGRLPEEDRKSTRLNSSHGYISYAVFCLKKKKTVQSATVFMMLLIDLTALHTACSRQVAC